MKNKPRTVEEYKEFLIGKKFGRLTVISHAGRIDGVQRWNCVCDCGKTCTRRTEAFIHRAEKLSCRCLQFEKNGIAHTKHGLHKSPEYGAYNHMKQRCFNEKCPEFFRYGGRGITVCERWLESFENFYEDMGQRPDKGMSLDRIDYNGNYEPSNCRWATALVQANNTRRNKWLIVNGVNDTISGHCRRLGLKKHTVLQRVRKGEKIENAFYPPIPLNERNKERRTA